MPSGYAKGKIVPKSEEIEYVQPSEMIVPVPKDASPRFVRRRFREAMADRREQRWADVLKAFAESPASTQVMGGVLGAIAGYLGNYPYDLGATSPLGLVEYESVVESDGTETGRAQFRMSFDAKTFLNTIFGINFVVPKLGGAQAGRLYLGWPREFTVTEWVSFNHWYNPRYDPKFQSLARKALQEKVERFLAYSGAGAGSIVGLIAASLSGLKGGK